MATFYKLSRFGRYCVFLNKNVNNTIGKSRCFRTVVEQPKPKSFLKISLISASIGALVGTGYSWKKISQDRKNIALEGTETQIGLLKYKPPITPSRKIVLPTDTTGLKLTLYQYQTCPFCCKVRVFLDYYGISYDVVEVDPVLRNEIKWSNYKKVPILLAKVDKGYQPLNDSSMIISLLSSYLTEKTQAISELANYYPIIAMHDDDGKFKHDVVNKYFLMYGSSIPKNRTMNDIVEERKWRKWADDVLVHVLSPNVYRSLDEAYQTFNWFSKIGQWEEYFPAWERIIMINVGACAMWLISKRLKRRHHLKNDVRESFYDEVNYWLDSIRAGGGQFMGGDNPNLSDLAVYGILKSIEGCEAFKDLQKNTDVSVWYNAMREKVDNHAGSEFISG